MAYHQPDHSSKCVYPHLLTHQWHHLGNTLSHCLFSIHPTSWPTGNGTTRPRLNSRVEVGTSSVVDSKFHDEVFALVFNVIEEYAPGFIASIIGYDILTPVDLERIFGLTGGVS